MAVFEHPMNGYRESVGTSAILWTLLFGCFYFAYKGAWGWAALSFFIVLIAGAITLGIGSLIAWIILAVAAPTIVEGSYLRRGWRRVE